MKGFYSSADVTPVRYIPTLPQCGACKFNLHCKSPKMKVSGKGKEGILIIGEYPGRQEDIEGRPFCGASGRILEEALGRLGIEMRQDCWLTNALICKPRGKPNKHIDYCRPNVIQTIKTLNPDVIILLGSTAVKSVVGWLWKEDVGAINRWVGWQIPCQKINSWLCPTWNPAYFLYEDEKKQTLEITRMFFEQHLKEAVGIKGKPWKRIPDYRSKVEIIHNPDEASKRIREFISSKSASFDYETDRLKPDHPSSEIICCAISDGNKTISYPWLKETAEATKDFLISDTPKILYNEKFEERWTRRHLKIFPSNVIFDGMLATHVLDNRKHICSLKFQAFVLLGVDSYDDGIKKYFETKGGNFKNKIRHINLDRLMLYCGMDALLEWKVASMQAPLLGVEI